ncbi:hypothetical protein EG343_11945 [Chryseobacterium nakagawai]|uniref:DoxX-like protein n=1 Tax=Chryseobacterium nakagawai TaxID=1241982 RepID=A0AAD0YK49_CHRNA|nr:hypothetical protein [Chryseobacterium nakagawai]AZA91297.1 hypothetical protein EG343_11945 [Chryseobacterium nakagawai]
MMRISKEKIINLIYWMIVLTVSMSMLIYGLSKPLQFSDYQGGTVLNTMSGHDIMWIFYGYSKAFPIIIGFFEVVGAILILFNRTRFFGCFLLSTMLINIIIQDYIFGIAALGTAIYYQILIIAILCFDSAKLKEVIKAFFKADKKEFSWITMIIALAFIFLLKLLETKIFN